VLFASSFAVFHGAEHISLGKADSVITSLITDNAGSFHSESEHHGVEESNSFGTDHSVESLCEACLLLSSLSAYTLSYFYLLFSSKKTKPKLFQVGNFERPAFQTYLSRAPPSNA
jgi:hypothetical protein